MDLSRVPQIIAFPGCFDFPATFLSLSMAFLRQSYSDQARCQSPETVSNSTVPGIPASCAPPTPYVPRCIASSRFNPLSAPTRINGRDERYPGSGVRRAPQIRPRYRLTRLPLRCGSSSWFPNDFSGRPVVWDAGNSPRNAKISTKARAEARCLMFGRV